LAAILSTYICRKARGNIKAEIAPGRGGDEGRNCRQDRTRCRRGSQVAISFPRRRGRSHSGRAARRGCRQ